MKQTDTEGACPHSDTRAPAIAQEQAPPPFERLPIEHPLPMPVQDFDRAPPYPVPASERRRPNVDMLARRTLILTLALIPAMLAAHEMKRTLGLNGISTWEAAYLALFIPLFAWIAFGFASSMVGFLLLLVADGEPIRLDRPRQRPVASGRTAILLPVCNEDFLAVLGRLSIMERSLRRAMGGDRFEFFILSDSNPENGSIEADSYRQMHGAFRLPVHYRRRAVNTGRKPGNIAEWVGRFGGAYDYMIVLDADSVMSGQTMARLAADMEGHPRLGLIQTIPSVAGASTLFARWQQFASRLYGPISAAGMIWWARSEGTFWGHNAIIRVKAFAECCGLPELRGPAPFGGHIMSHDMIEAALLRRRGWAVHMAMAEDSYEEFPPSLPDLATRDRRWCQGNIQHVPLLMRIAGLHPVNRFQLLVGASAYLTSPLWLMLILVVLAGEYLDIWSAGNILPSGSLLWLTIVLLFGPKLMALIWAVADPGRRQSFGGTGTMLRGIGVDLILSVLMAPVSMISQTMNLIGILLGRKSAWNGQTRDRDGMGWGSALWIFRYHVLAGAAMLAVALQTDMAIIWLVPVVLGLLLAPALAAITARKDLGTAAADSGLFRVPDPWWRAPGYLARRRLAPIVPEPVVEEAYPPLPLAFAANDQ